MWDCIGVFSVGWVRFSVLNQFKTHFFPVSSLFVVVFEPDYLNRRMEKQVQCSGVSLTWLFVCFCVKLWRENVNITHSWIEPHHWDIIKTYHIDAFDFQEKTFFQRLWTVTWHSLRDTVWAVWMSGPVWWICRNAFVLVSSAATRSSFSDSLLSKTMIQSLVASKLKKHFFLKIQ